MKKKGNNMGKTLDENMAKPWRPLATNVVMSKKMRSIKRKQKITSVILLTSYCVFQQKMIY